MLQVSGHKFYLAMKGQQYVGVFSSPEKAQTAEHDSLTEIDPFLLKGSPVSDRYVCMAKGSCVMLLRKEEGFETAYFDLGPSWGLNPQSAVIGLCGIHNSRKNIITTELYLFESDRAYAADEPRNLYREDVFSSLTKRTYDRDSLSDEQIKKDYLKIYLDRLHRDAVRAEKASSPELQLIIDRAMTAAYLRLKDTGRTLRCGVPIERLTARMTDRLIAEFSMQEMRQLAELLQRDISKEEIPHTKLSEAETDLIRRLAKHIPDLHLLPDRRRSMHSRNILDYLY